ncbi:MAG: SAM-dependent methyltransferase [Streptosporangiaceae bacterium]
MSENGGRPARFSLRTPSTARVYDYLLGGKDNFAWDRELAATILESTPDAREVLRANRAFLGRAVRFVAGAGVRQFWADADGAAFVRDINGGDETVPTVSLAGRTVTNPAPSLVLHELAKPDATGRNESEPDRTASEQPSATEHRPTPRRN